MIALPTIYDEDIDTLTARLQTSLEANLGRTLAPADIEMLIANAIAYEIQLLRIAGNNAMRQNLVDFATAPMLDYLGALVGVTRLPAAAAECMLQFTIVAGNPYALTVPQGTRVQSVDGKVIFQTLTDATAPPSTLTTPTTVTVQAICNIAGTAGNGYIGITGTIDVPIDGKINILLDPLPFIIDASNKDTTNAGIDAETDDQLRSRIKLAPSSFSVAGPTEAYEFFAKSAHPSIVDVKCVTTNPGEVTLYVLCDGGVSPIEDGEVLKAVSATCNDEKVRPQNDSVIAAPPLHTFTYTIDITLTLFTGAVAQTVMDTVTAALNNYVATNKNKLGIDVVISELIALAKIEGQVYDLVVNSPTANMVAGDSDYNQCLGVNVHVNTTTNGG